MNRHRDGWRPEWFWGWLSNATFVSAYDDKADDEIPF
jgi:hypothetical protein